MHFDEIRQNLMRKIEAELLPLIDRDYRLLEIPDYPNVGDVLIFQGELAFLRKVPFRCVEMATMRSFANRLPRIAEDELLIFSGGGYFGDLWPAGPAFQRIVLQKYPKNPMLILPQSVRFDDSSKLLEAVKLYGSHENLSICLRDKDSYNFIRENFPNKAYLVPDMAFFAKVNGSKKCVGHCDRKLLILRNDKELLAGPALAALQDNDNCDVRDWPTMENTGCIEWLMTFVKQRPSLCGRCYDAFVRYCYRAHVLASGVRLVNQYDQIISTRLHGCVLALLLQKRVQALDNSYGKIYALIDTWLQDCEEICKIG